ncbi:cyanase [Acuticoccus yangtzensis]|uniref:cyanase n=1 Tax=Acuticoccus yangtzensis TaxID=1443441 RepID=UPI000949680B|nr:cyanase [Acuticoccus yangtzensis]ORE92597.1 cyanate hydratase [Stappia sp. 22II-S9-Z10]
MLNAKRAELTEKIVAHKTFTGKKWSEIADAVGMSKEWTTAALMGQISLTKEQAEKAGNSLGLNFSDEEIALLMMVPYRGSLPTAVPTDPLIYRLYEIVSVYGTTMKALIEEEFGDGIMSAIDFDMDITRVPHEKGDRVKVTMSGKFLPYKSY